MLANGHTVMAWAEYLSRLEVHKCQLYICIGPRTEMAVPLKMSSEGAPNVLYPFFVPRSPSSSVILHRG